MLNKKPEACPGLITPSKCWSDHTFSAGKDVILDLYHKLDLRLDIQTCLENKQQASVYLHDQDKDICICRYLYNDNGIAVRGDNLGIILTPEQVYTLRRGNDMLFVNLSQSLAPMANEKCNPVMILQQILQKVYHSSTEVLAHLDEDLSSWQQNFEKDGSLPEGKQLAHMHAALGEAASIVAGHHKLLQELPAALGISPAGEYSKSYGLLQAECANMQMALNNCLFLVDALNKARSQELLSKNTNAIRSLTTLCAVFLPIIFIATLYSMRFENMPELKSTWGYIICIAVMAIVALYSWKQNR